MRIGFVIPDLRGGGAEQVIINLANYLSNIHNVFLFVGKNQGKCRNKISEKVEIIELSGSNKGLVNLIPIIKLTKHYTIDVLIGTLSMAFVVSIASIFLKKTKCIARIGNTLSSDIESKSRLNKVLFKIYFQMLIFADVIICQSDYMLNDLISLTIFKNRLITKSKVIKNPIDIKKINNEISNISLFPFDKIKLISIGRIDYQKDYFCSLNVVKELVNRGHKVELTILGEGPLLEELEIYCNKLNIAPYVSFLGYVSEPKEIILSSHILLLTSLYEGYSNVIVESLCNGIPVVATDSPGGNREIIKNAINGYLSDVGDFKDIADNIELLLANYNEIRTNIINSNVRDVHSIKSIAESYIKVMN
ncbi:glycosyltransferase [Aliivibrio fischeri]|uniref:glycosyltransferase n=1 Tax=Aliivibrio fischeri TaxID=668 RepID=UPI001F2672EF|nr:glycosyltransferase [Aliivibrio fischeri]MCE7577989.1 glycosyltransferase [Aliivibrio fischeri]MCE7590377.1 glycosyltransferase [Aliivibrio fischeri]